MAKKTKTTTKRKSTKTTKKAAPRRKTSPKKPAQTTSVFQLLGLALVVSLAWALTDTSNAYAIMLTCIFGLSLSVHAYHAGADVWDDYVKKYKKKKGASELFFAPNKGAYYLQMYFVFPAMAVFCFLGIVFSARIILGL